LNDELTILSASDIARAVRARCLSPVEITEVFLRRAEGLNAQLNAVVTFAPDATEQAQEAERAVTRRNARLGLLHGVPVTIKDTIDTVNLRTTSGSNLRRSHIPQADAPAVARLKRAGAIILGKTNTSEMAIPYECDNPLFGRTNNPHDLKRTPGGSSGGCAAAVSACLAPISLGTDLSGSIRVPAHFCGVAGFKPESSRVSGEGHVPPVTGAFTRGASFGPLARTIEDIKLMFDVLSDAASAEAKDRAEINLRECRFSVWPADPPVAPVTTETKDALERAARILCEAGLPMIDESPPAVARASALWFDLFARHAAKFVREMYAGELEAEAGMLVARALRSELPEANEQAAQEIYPLRAVLIEWMTANASLIVAPVGSFPAFQHGARRVLVGSESISIFRAFGYARAFNALDLPAITVPVLRSKENLPVGVQIAARPGDESRLFAAAMIIEEATGGWIRPPAPYSPASSQNE
jgi:amidase